MINLIIGFVFGFFVATVGFTGIAQALDNGIETVKNVSVKVDTGK
jgi:capsular polysaccharide biosynthesis protein